MSVDIALVDSVSRLWIFADLSQAELEVLEAYLPAQLTRVEIIAEARKVMDETGASSPADKGKVMPVLMKRLGDRADGRTVNEVVTELLSGSGS